MRTSPRILLSGPLNHSSSPYFHPTRDLSCPRFPTTYLFASTSRTKATMVRTRSNVKDDHPPSSPLPSSSASSAPLYTVLLPTYNERENIGLCVYMINKAMEQGGYKYEIIVIDDNSPDGTQEIVKKLQKAYGNDKILLKPRAGKLGLGTAYIHGLQFASGDFVFLMDADLSHHPKNMLDFIKRQRETGADIVTGTRYARLGGVYGWDLKRKFTSKGANILASVLLGTSVSDLTGSYRLYRRDVLSGLMRSVKSKGYAFQMEIIARATAAGCRIAEVPIVFVDRLYGDSKLGAMEIVTYIKGLANLVLTL